MVEQEQNRTILSMEYVPTTLVDFESILSRTLPSREVPTTGITLYSHRPLKYLGRFNSTPKRLE